MKAKRVTWYPYSKQTIISKNKMVKIMNRNNGKYRVLTWKAFSQTKARLTPSSLFLLSLENLLSTPPTGFFSSPPSNFSSPLFSIFPGKPLLTSLCLTQGRCHPQPPPASHAPCRPSMQPIFLQKEVPPLQKNGKNFPVPEQMKNP